MAKQVKVLASQPDDVSSIPGMNIYTHTYILVQMRKKLKERANTNWNQKVLVYNCLCVFMCVFI